MDKTLLDIEQLDYALGKPQFSGRIKVVPEDFMVEEVINYSLSGSGEHLWCWVEKKNQNTDWVAGQLAKWAQTSKRNVGYAGKKDRHAVTRQWFSICLPGKPDPDIELLKLDGVEVLALKRHDRKLQRGGLSGNNFQLRIRNLQSIHDHQIPLSEIKKSLELRLFDLQERGFPNYFGPQRFGRDGNNLVEAEKLFKNLSMVQKERRRKRKANNLNQQNMYISAARSWVFNLILSQRVALDNWDKLIDGDVLNLNGSSKWFSMEEGQVEELQERLLAGDIHPTALLIGDGESSANKLAREVEESVESEFLGWKTALQSLRVKVDRRALRVIPQRLNWQWVTDQDEQNEFLELSFFLPSGCYATSLVRELVEIG